MNPLAASTTLKTLLPLTKKMNTQLVKVMGAITVIAKRVGKIMAPMAAGTGRIAKSLGQAVPVVRSLLLLLRILGAIRPQPTISLSDQLSKKLSGIKQKLKGFSKLRFPVVLFLKDKISGGIKTLKGKYLNPDTLVKGGKWLFNATLGSAMQQNPQSGAAKSWNRMGASADKIKGRMSSAFTQIGSGNLDKLEELLLRIEGYAQNLAQFTGGEGFQKFVELGSSALGKLLDASIAVLDFMEGLGQWISKNKEIIIPIVSGIAAAITVFGVIVPMITALQGVLIALIPVIAGISWPILAVVAAVAAVVAIWRNWDTIVEAFTAIKDKFINRVVELIAAAKEKFAGLVSAAQGFGKGLVDSIVNGIKSAPGALLKALESMLPPWVVDTLQAFGFSFGDKPKKAKGKALGLAYVPYDNYPALLHRGEQVLTRAEADQYRRGQGSFHLAKLADTIVIREEADINRIANAIASRLKGAQVNYGGVTA